MNNLTVDECKRNAYSVYSAKLMNSEKQQKAFFSELKNRGYNAVVDYNDAKPGTNGKSYYEAPIIVFEKSNNLRQISATPITYKDKENAEYEISKRENEDE